MITHLINFKIKTYLDMDSIYLSNYLNPEEYLYLFENIDMNQEVNLNCTYDPITNKIIINTINDLVVINNQDESFQINPNSLEIRKL